MIRQVQIKNYKSIAQAVVNLERLTVLIGPNGSGKSNFLDALSFVADCLTDGVELAFKNRGGIAAVRRRSGGHPTHVGIKLVIELQDGKSANYSFEISAGQRGSFSVAREKCSVYGLMAQDTQFEVENGQFKQPIKGIAPKLEPDRLALFAASATSTFRPVYDSLTAMRFYSIVPSALRELQDPDSGNFLKRDGSNAAAVLKRISEVSAQNGETYRRICSLLSKVVPGLRRAEYRSFAQKETIQFKQDVGLRDPWTFDALNMSDGTLRVLGVLLAIYQPSTPTLIAIEEPEATVHPGVSELLVDVLIDGARKSQILFSTHSPDILDNKAITDTQIRIVESENGATLISPLSNQSRKVIRDKLYTAGELLRVNELHADKKATEEITNELNLFSHTNAN